jgi:hypothetical protein
MLCLGCTAIENEQESPKIVEQRGTEVILGAVMRLMGFNAIVERLVYIAKTKMNVSNIAQERGYGVVGGWFLPASTVILSHGLQGVFQGPQSMLKLVLLIPCSCFVVVDYSSIREYQNNG